MSICRWFQFKFTRIYEYYRVDRYSRNKKCVHVFFCWFEHVSLKIAKFFQNYISTDGYLTISS